MIRVVDVMVLVI